MLGDQSGRDGGIGHRRTGVPWDGLRVHGIASLAVVRHGPTPEIVALDAGGPHMHLTVVTGHRGLGLRKNLPTFD